MLHEKDDGHKIILPDGREITDSEERYVFFTTLDQYQSTLYKVKRASEYPSIQDQLDTLYHGGYDVWKAQIESVKNKYPKPSDQTE
jgi:hypothetical protein